VGSITSQLNTALLKAREKRRESPHSYKMLIGDVLLKKDVISGDQLKIALKIQKEKLQEIGKTDKLGLILVKLGYESEEKLVKTINEHYQIGVASLTDNIENLIS